jgi:Bacterial EndoU nuclease
MLFAIGVGLVLIFVSTFINNQKNSIETSKINQEDLPDYDNFADITSPVDNLVFPNFLIPQSFKHITEGSINRYKEATGFHLKSASPDQSTRVVKITNQPNNCGVYKAQVIIQGKPKQALSSMFPDRLNKSQLLQILKDAYLNSFNKGQNNSTLTIKTKDCFSLFMVIDKNNKIITSYPIY